MTRDSHDPKMVVLLGLVIAAVILLAYTAIFVTPTLIAGANNTGAVRDGTDLQGCRSERNTAVTDAADTVDRASVGLQVAIAHVVSLSLAGDRAGAHAAGPAIDAAAVEALQAQAAKTTAVSRYKAEIRLSRTDPAKFLHLCTKG